MTLRLLALGFATALATACGGADSPTADSQQASADAAAEKTTMTSQANGGGSDSANPFFSDYDTPFGVPPFEAIENAHFLPAFEHGMKESAAEIVAIANNPDAPTFANTIEAMELSGVLLTRVSRVFFNLRSAHTNPEIDEAAKKVGPQLSKHNDDIVLNERLFDRVNTIYEQRDSLGLTPEQMRLLTETWKGFVRGGANVADANKARLREVNGELSVLSIKFGENLLKENNGFRLVLENEADLAGLPESVVASAAQLANDNELDGKWMFNLSRTSIEPFLSYSSRRDLREQMLKAYLQRGDNGNDNDNKSVLAEIAALRAERASLLGYETHAHYVLDDNMARNPDKVYALIDRLWPAALERAGEEVAEMQAMIDASGDGFELAPWDWRYYSEQVRQARYNFDENEVRPYFELDAVIGGAFLLAEKLYGIKFIERDDLPKYHEDVRGYEVREADGTLIGIYLTDYFPRPSKRGGAWMNAYRQQRYDSSERVLPIISNVGNFTKPAAGKPALLRSGEVNTLFHEFGHALHGLLSNARYSSLAGTSVDRDFVEFPSQMMENWAMEPEMLRAYAKHYQTGEPIPDALIEKIQNTAKFNQGFATVEYLAASLLDLDWHTLTDSEIRDADDFERASLSKMGLIGEIPPRYRSTYFSHIFAGGYAAGYYSYIWAEVLDADAFKAFKDTGDIFNPDLAKKYRENILARGGTQDAMELYRSFRGAEPDPAALIERRGLN